MALASAIEQGSFELHEPAVVGALKGIVGSDAFGEQGSAAGIDFAPDRILQVRRVLAASGKTKDLDPVTQLNRRPLLGFDEQALRSVGDHEAVSRLTEGHNAGYPHAMAVAALRGELKETADAASREI